MPAYDRELDGDKVYQWLLRAEGLREHRADTQRALVSFWSDGSVLKLTGTDCTTL